MWYNIIVDRKRIIYMVLKIIMIVFHLSMLLAIFKGLVTAVGDEKDE